MGSPVIDHETHLLEVIEYVIIAIENNQPVYMIFLDFKKIFDSVPHQRLITKLNMHGILGTILNWIRNFLSERQHKVKVSNTFFLKQLM